MTSEIHETVPAAAAAPVPGPGGSRDPSSAPSHQSSVPSHQSSTPSQRSSVPSQRSADRPPRFRADVEGLRAVAVLAVLAFHSGIPLVTGGYVGVDVFFVVSGFLITGLLLAEVRRSGTVRLGDFYARRARRILPAAGLVLVVTGLAAALLLPPLRLLDITRDVVSSALYVANWRFVDGQVDYLASAREHSPLLHYWSLAVEEQFYLVWPAMVLLAAWLARRTGRRVGPIVAGSCLLLTAGSLALSLHLTRTAEPVAYLSSPSRAWQFGTGALVAVVVARVWAASTRRGVGPVLALAGWVGLALVLVSAVVFDDDTPYPGTAALVPTVGTALVILAGLDARRRRGDRTGDHRTGDQLSRGLGVPRVGDLLAHPVLRHLGRLSYAWYLWHWPVIVLTEGVAGSLPWPVKTALAAASAVPAELTVRLLEGPIRFSPRVATSVRFSFAVGLVAMLVPVGGGMGLRGFATTSIAAAAAPAPSQTVLQAAMTGPVSHRESGPVTPGPGAARVNRPESVDCLLQPDQRRSEECVFGDAPQGRRVVLFGDSHAEQWFTPLRTTAEERGYRVRVLSKAACPPMIMKTRHPWTNQPYAACDDWRSWALDEIERERPDLIVIGSLSQYAESYGVDSAVTGWDLVHERLAASGATLVYLRDTPFMEVDVPVCVSGAVGNWEHCASSRKTALAEDPVATRVADAYPDVRLVDLTPYLCPGRAKDPCPAVRDGVMLYRDRNHLTDAAARGLQPVLAAALDPVLDEGRAGLH
ncbi:MAG: acyltransferase [Actinomycetales bacterium]|nr:acyltransferase [Actinomycetales bacterium]